MKNGIKQVLSFTYQQAMSCVFPVAIFLTLALTKKIHLPFVYRYDLILVVCLLVQYIMYKSGLETKDEVKVIAVFHVIGLGLEIYKVHMGSWAYPEFAWSKVFGVLLYSGFMYASVASYMCQAWRRLNVALVGWPSGKWTAPLGAAIYLNFFTHHFIPDLRWVLSGILFIVLFRTTVKYRVDGRMYRMPLVFSFFLIGLFVWFAENIATFFGAWQYPDQKLQWHMVHFGKISSWFMLVIISFVIVAQLKHVKEGIKEHYIQEEANS